MSKPEYNPTSIKFKIQLAAFYHVPEVIIFQLAREPLKPGADTTFVLKVTNPTQHPTSFQLMDLDQGKVLKKLVVGFLRPCICRKCLNFAQKLSAYIKFQAPEQVSH